MNKLYRVTIIRERQPGKRVHIGALYIVMADSEQAASDKVLALPVVKDYGHVGFLVREIEGGIFGPANFTNLLPQEIQLFLNRAADER